MDFGGFNSGFMDSSPDFRSNFKVFRPDSTDFTSDLKDFTPDLRYFRSDFKGYMNFRECRAFR